MGFVENIHVALMEKFWEHLNYNFLYKFVSIFGACALPSDPLSVMPCGRLSDSSFLGLYSVDKVSSEFLSLPSSCCFKTHQKCRQTCRHRFLCERAAEAQIQFNKINMHSLRRPYFTVDRDCVTHIWNAGLGERLGKSCVGEGALEVERRKGLQGWMVVRWKSSALASRKG